MLRHSVQNADATEGALNFNRSCRVHGVHAESARRLQVLLPVVYEYHVWRLDSRDSEGTLIYLGVRLSHRKVARGQERVEQSDEPEAVGAMRGARRRQGRQDTSS